MEALKIQVKNTELNKNHHIHNWETIKSISEKIAWQKNHGVDNSKQYRNKIMWLLNRLNDVDKKAMMEVGVELYGKETINKLISK